MVAHLLEVPEDLSLPEITAEDLRVSALMDQTARIPFATRGLNHVGKYVYQLAIAEYLWKSLPGHPKLQKIQTDITLDAEVLNISETFKLPGILGFDRKPTPEYNPALEVFYAWMGAVYVEQGLYPVLDFVGALVEANLSNILKYSGWPTPSPTSDTVEQAIMPKERKIATPRALRPLLEKLKDTNISNDATLENAENA
ncbi:hypothetical protein ABW19_dt0206714 [Dactylella cylindrospora]|nr:hypothetical protein ABW19_dt0206714 [Dactylella cylindrospora]